MYIPILIVGAGPAGLTSAIVLSRFGIRTLLVERHPSTSVHPKATAISTRTMELFREWGIEPEVREHALDVRFANSVRHSLAEPELERRPLGFPEREQASALSPTMPAGLAQDILEPILVDHARSYGLAELRFNTDLCDLEQDADGVTATVVDRVTGERTEVRCRYLVAADGAVLVRPDGHIAWRSASVAADPSATLSQVVARVLGFSDDERHARMAATSATLGRRSA